MSITVVANVLGFISIAVMELALTSAAALRQVPGAVEVGRARAARLRDGPGTVEGEFGEIAMGFEGARTASTAERPLAKTL